MIKILQITGSLQIGGIETFVLNTYKKINREKFKFYFLIPENEKHSLYQDEIIKLGGEIIRVPRRRKIFQHISFLINIFKNNDFDVVHMHSSSISYILPLVLATLSHINKRIIHSHNSRYDGNIFVKLLEKINKSIVRFFVTDFYACSKSAAQWMFPRVILKKNRYKIILNAIDSKEFKFDSKNRKKIRSELSIEDNQILIGHVGRFSKQKNHKYIINAFDNFIKNNVTNFKLLLVGNGELMDEIKSFVVQKGLEKDIIFTGIRPDVNMLLSAMDVFFLPSLYEGLPVTIIEAQCANLPCLLADTITHDVKINNNVQFFDLNEDYNSVYDKLINIVTNDTKREDNKTNFFSSDYNMNNYIKKLENEYINN